MADEDDDALRRLAEKRHGRAEPEEDILKLLREGKARLTAVASSPKLQAELQEALDRYNRALAPAQPPRPGRLFFGHRPNKPAGTFDAPKVDKERVEAWLSRKWKGDLACPICEDKQWLISDDFIALTTTPGPVQLGGTLTYPSVQLICVVCGYVLLFNWGIILRGEEPSRG